MVNICALELFVITSQTASIYFNTAGEYIAFVLDIFSATFYDIKDPIAQVTS